MRKKWLLRALCGLAACFTAFGFASCFGGGGGDEQKEPESVSTVGKELSSEEVRSLMTWETKDSGLEITGLNFRGDGDGRMLEKLEIPRSIDGVEVTSIARQAFQDCDRLKSVMIPDSVTEIGYGAFWGCRALEYLTIGNGVKFLGDMTFASCGNVHVTIGSGVERIAETAFQGTGCATSNGDGLYYIGNWLLTSSLGYGDGSGVYKIKEGTTRIADGALKNLGSYLKRVSIPASVEYVGLYAFESTGLEALDIEDLTAWCEIKLETVSEFYLFPDLDLYVDGKQTTELEIPHGTTVIEEGVFWHFKNIKSVSIPSTVTRIEEGAFSESGLTSATIQAKTVGAFAFQGCDSLESVTFGYGVIEIEENAFSSCEKLTSVTFGETLTSIGKSAFENSGLDFVILPNSIKHIGEKAFYRFVGFTSVVLPPNVESVENSGISGRIFFTGTQAEWNVLCENEKFSYKWKDPYFYMENEADVPNSGLYWHYVDGVPTIWEF